MAEVLQCAAATMIINWLSAIRWWAGTCRPSRWRTVDGGLRVRHTQARETTVMKNKCRRDLPSHNDEIFNPSGWEREEGGFSSPRQRWIQRHHELGRENGNGEVKKKRAIEKSPAVKLAADRFWFVVSFCERRRPSASQVTARSLGNRAS